MKRRRHTPEQIIRGLREPERMLGEGKQIPDAAKELERGGRRPGPAGEPGGSLPADRRSGGVERGSPRRVLPLPDR